MRRIGLTLCVLLLLAPWPAWPQGNPAGSEFRVNTYAYSAQRSPAVASDASGNFVVVWTSFGQDGSDFGVFGQRFADSGSPIGPEFRVNTDTTGFQYDPAVASDPLGNFVVVWQAPDQDGSGGGVFGQRYASSGSPLGPEFRVNTYTTNSQEYPSVAVDGSGNFAVVWASLNQIPGSNDIYGQRYASSGAAMGPEFLVNTVTDAAQTRPSVAADDAGNFVVVWMSFAFSIWDVLGQRYAATGAPLGSEFRVNTYTTDFQINPSVAADPAGDFVVVWASYGGSGGHDGIYAQRFAPSGVPVGSEFRADTSFAPYVKSPKSSAVALDAAGDFVVAWNNFFQDGSGDGVFAQRFASTGAPLGLEFRVNTFTQDNQNAPVVAADAVGDFVVVWASLNQDGPFDNVYAQRFRPIVPVELMAVAIE
jgi:hypothetical protein